MNRVLIDDFKRIRPYIADIEALRASSWLITGSRGMMCSYLIAFLCWLNEADLDGSMKITALQRKMPNVTDPNVGFLVRREYIEFREVDLSNEFTLRENDRFDYVVHGATYAAPENYLADPIATINVNVKATQILLEHFKESKYLKAYINVSSGEIYGDVDSKDVPTKEEYLGRRNHLNARSCYSESKRFSETLCWHYLQQYQVPIKIIRPIQVYGPGFKENDKRVWVDFIVNASKGKDLEILGDGTSRRGFCYQADALTQILAVVQRGSIGGVYNIGVDEHVSISELADMIAIVADHPVKVIVKNRLPAYLRGNPQIACPSIDRVRALSPLLKTPLKQGLGNTYDWFNSVLLKKTNYQ